MRRTPPPGLPRQSPYRRKNPSGREVWIARYRGRDGRLRYAKPVWNGRHSTFDLKRDAQRAIDEALERHYGLVEAPATTVGAYLPIWLDAHPRSARTNATNRHRIERVLDVPLEGIPLGEWELDELKRRHVSVLVDHLLRDHGRAVQGVRGIVGSLSAMCEDAIDDQLAGANPFKGLRLRKTDPRARRRSRSIRIWSFEEMHAFAAAGRSEVRARTRKPNSKRCYSGHNFEPLLRTFADTGMRLGEILPLRREDFDGRTFHVRRTAHEGRVEAGTKTEHGEEAGGRIVPCPAGLSRMIRDTPTRIDTDLLFPTPRGRLWRERNFYRDVWQAARDATGLDPRPHEFRHSYVSHLRAAGIDDADLADVAGHRVETMLSRYTHPLGRSHDRIREVVG